MPHHRRSNMDQSARSERNMLISMSMSETKEKRKTQSCKVFTVKIQSNKLNQKQKEQLKMLFVEAKWIRNEMIAFGQDNPIFDYKCGDLIQVMNKDGVLEPREKKFISAQQTQSVIDEVKDNIRALARVREKGKKIGSLKFTSEVKSINLKQFGATYKIKSETKMKIQGVSGDVRVKGLHQLDPDCDCANAKLISRPDGYYVAITTYVHKSKVKDQYETGTSIGLDMGIKDNITLSNGKKINVYVEETERLKTLQRELSRRKKGSNNRDKTIKKIRKEYQQIGNVKNDIANKIVSELKQFEHIYFQDENIKGWKNKKSLARGSKKIQHSVLGRVKMKLKNCPRAIMLDQFIPTTQSCICGCKNKHNLSQRIYECACGYSCDRDIHSANMMILFGQNLIGTEHTEFTPVENLIPTALPGRKSESMKQEAARSLA